MVQVIARVHPFAPAQREAKEFPDGTTLQEIVSALVPVEVGRVIVMRDGEEVPRDRWGDSVSGGLVNVAVVPAGSEEGFRDAAGKTAGWSVALGVALFAASIITPIGWLAWAGVGLAVVGTIVAGGLATAANMLAAVSESTEATLAIAGGRNTVAPWGKVPVIIGKHRLTPHYAAGYYTYVCGDDGEDQYLKQIFCLGRNTLKVSDIKIGENLLATNTADTRNGSIAVDGVYSDVTMQIYQDGTAPSEYPALVTQDEIGAALVYNTAVWRTSAKKTTELTVSINVAGLYKTVNNTRVDHTVTVEARYRAVGSGTAWASCPLIGTLDVTKALAKLLRYELTVEVDEGQYEVGVMRTSADDPDGFDGASATTWATLRSLRNVPVVSAAMRAKVVLLAVTIKATDQLNGVIDNLNCICESVEHIYSGGNWTSTAVSRNPASHIIDGLVHGRFLNTAVPSAAIDWPAFQSWYTLCATNSWYCDKVISSAETLQSLCNKIAHTGRAYITLRDGLYTVVCDSARTTVVQHFTPRNVKSFSWTKSFADLPHGYRIGFLSADDDYQTSERLCLYDEYTEETATKLERVDLWGITDADQVWKHGRYLLACRRLRPEAYTFETDVESIVCEPGDLILVAHDSIAVGIISGRVKALVLDESDDVVGVEIDEAIVAEAGVDYGVQIRAVDGFYYRTCTVDGNELTFSEVVAAGSLAVGDLYTLGEAGTETLRCVVSSIETGQEFGAKITCLDEAPDIHTADSGDIPAYSPLIGRKGQITTLDSNVKADLALTAAATAQATAAAATTSLAPAAIAQYNPAYTPEIPDDPAVVAYTSSFTSLVGSTIDGWGASLSSSTISYTNDELIVTPTGTQTFTQTANSPLSSTVPGKVFTAKIYAPIATTIRLMIRNSSTGDYTTLVSKSVTNAGYYILSGYVPATGYDFIGVRQDQKTNAFKVNVVQIGTGAYLSPTLDTSGNGNHLTNTAAVPVDFNGRKWWAFNGSSSNLVATTAILGATGFFSRRIRTPAAFTEQFICGNLSGNTGCALKIMAGGTLRLAVGNGSTVVNLDTTVAASTEYWIACYIGATSATLYKDGVFADTDTVTMSASSTAWAEGKDPASAARYWKGYTSEPYATTILPTAAQIRDLYVNGLPAELYTLADYAARTLVFSGPTIFKYASGAVVPSPTSVAITATPQAYTPTSYQWQYYAVGWNNLANESGKVSGVTTATLTLTYDATVWSTDAVLRLRCTADGISRELTVYKVADGAGLTIKGTVLEPADLGDIVNPATGDVYIVLGAGSYGGVTYAAGDGARYTGSAWENIGAIQGPAGRNAPQYLGIGLLADTANATFRLDTVDSDGTITTGTNVTAVAGDLMVNHHATYEAVGIYLFDGTNWAITTSARYLQLASIDIENLFTGGISVAGVEVIQTAIINNLKTRVIAFEESVSAIKRATAGTLTAGDTQISMGFDPAIPRWTAGKVVALGYLIREDGNVYVCSTAGTTGTTAPTWPSSGAVNDGTAVWRFVSAAEYEFAVSKYLGTVGGNEVWQKQFLTKALRYGLIGLLLIGGLESCAPIYSDPGRVWYRQESPFGTARVNGIAYGNGKWVAGGAGGKLAYSTNGETWTLVSSSPFISDVRAVACGNGKWVAGDISGKLAYSSNGETWTLVSSSPFGTSAVWAVAYGNGKWVAGATGGKLAYSTNGETWTLVSSSPFTLGGNARGIAYGAEKWIVCCGREVAYSTNGETWTLVSPTVFGSGYLCNSVAYGNGAFVATGGRTGASGWTAYSSDGLAWALVSPTQLGTSHGISVVNGNGRWVVVGEDGKIVHSYSSSEWSASAISPYGTDGYYMSAAYSDDQKRWIVVGYLSSDNSGIIITSDYLESGMGFTSRTVDTNNRAYYSLQDGARLYDGRGAPWSWVNFDGETSYNRTGTYARSGTTVTVTLTAHGFRVGDWVNVYPTSGGVTRITAKVTTVPNANTFTYTHTTSGTASGNCALYHRAIFASGNVYGNIIDEGVGRYLVNMIEDAPHDYYCVGTNHAINGDRSITLQAIIDRGWPLDERAYRIQLQLSSTNTDINRPMVMGWVIC